MKLIRLAAALSAAAALSLSGLATASATPVAPLAKAAVRPAPEIIAGSVADFSTVPYAAQQYVNGSFNCSASIISATWVLLAKHCVENVSASSITFKLGSATRGQGTTIGVKRVAQWSSGDVALAELKSAFQGSYATLGAGNPSVGASGNIYGWGRETVSGPAASQLKTAVVQVTGLDSSHWPGPAIAHKGIDGQALYGDSGGPLVIGGKVVGVCSGPVSSSDIGDAHGNVLYASVPASASWIQSVSGVSAQ
ncbi:S1 family peptidase [Psychromicrobium sp. YIM B11713]|uniref:S1 family peptidase n=1 Tax=Psychromicrobium sp. YIM B11713 TaxID=3145233 RepID=UPI00374E560D